MRNQLNVIFETREITAHIDRGGCRFGIRISFVVNLEEHRSLRPRKGDLRDMEQSEFRLAEVSVVMLGISDLSRSLGFYCGKLGLNLQREFPGIAFLDGGKVALCLSEPAAKMRGRLPGSGEIGFSVKDVNAASRGLEARGVIFTHGPRSLTPTHWIANFEDPDGNHLSISGPATSSPE